MRFWICLVLLMTAAGLPAQERNPELFALGGAARVTGDEGSLGTGWVAGGAVTLPFARRWALDVSADHLRSERRIGAGRLLGSHTHVSPGIQYRRGNGRTYGFVAGGPGVTLDSGDEASSGLHWHARSGFVTQGAGRLILRVEMFAVFRFVQPDFGFRAGIGYRFGD